MAKLSLSDVHGPPLSKAYRREGESTVVKRVRLKRKARSQSKVVSSAPSVPSVPSATPDPSEQPSPPSMMGEPRKRALKKQSDYVGWCERRALVQSRWLTRDYPCARSPPPCSNADGGQPRAERDGRQGLKPPTVPDRRPQPDRATFHRELCPPEVRASSSPSCAIDASMTLVNGSQTFFAG
jgi:hypothetical protein